MNQKIKVVIAATTMITSPAYAEWPAWEDARIYLGAETGTYKSKMKSGGFNILGPHDNTNDDRDSAKLLGIKVGAEFMDRWRVDLAYREYNDQDYTTGSFSPPTPTFFYNSEIESKTALITAYYDFYEYGKFDFYGGLGVGVSRTKVSTNDGIAMGSGSDTKSSWQLELGVDYPLADSLVVNAGVRHTDLGKSKIDLQHILLGVPAGNFTADLSSTDIFIGLRYTF